MNQEDRVVQEFISDLDKLLLLFDNARKVPFTDNIIISKEAVKESIEKIKRTKSDSFGAAGAVINEKASIIAMAQRDASAIVSRSEEEGARHKQEANQYYNERRREAEELMEQAKVNINAMMENAQIQGHQLLAEAQVRHDDLVSKERVIADATVEAEQIRAKAIELTTQRKKEVYTDLITLIGDVELSFKQYSDKLSHFKSDLLKEVD